MSIKIKALIKVRSFLFIFGHEERSVWSYNY